ncbi:MAG: hypothetical protein ACRCX2_38015 [Paraclostridium sp.]
MNKELKELIELCEELEHTIEDFRYSNFNKCYIARVKPITVAKDLYVVAYEDDKWVIE